MKLIEIAAKIIVWFALFFYIGLCWVGAEYVFEGAAHISKIDIGVAGILAWLVVREIDRFDKKVGGG